ncbi:hypothetical protein N431DRAFT_164698 [Stipitochalara longipes BDJ]|nr:hypothetical protein N431DRAFT_164698 [Stipitochalara longipes BDJ]
MTALPPVYLLLSEGQNLHRYFHLNDPDYSFLLHYRYEMRFLIHKCLKKNCSFNSEIMPCFFAKSFIK